LKAAFALNRIKNEKRAMHATLVFIDPDEGLPAPFKKCKKTVFLTCSKNTFFVMTRVGLFSANKIENSGGLEQ
jgi:hypothetical protein